MILFLFNNGFFVLWTAAAAATMMVPTTSGFAFGPTRNQQRRLQAFSTPGITRQSTSRLGLYQDRFDMDELKKRIAKETNPYAFLFREFHREDDKPGDRYQPPEYVHIISFNFGTNKQGMHTIEFPKGSGSNVILAFESKEACAKFGSLLKAQEFFDPTPQEVTLESLESFSDSLGVFVQVVPEGVELVPPSGSVQQFGHDPSLAQQKRHLESIFDMADEDDFEEQGALAAEMGVSPAVTAATVPGSWE